MNEKEIRIPGLDTNVGLCSCNDSMEIYCIVLKSVYQEGFEKIQQIEKFYEIKNYAKYGVLVHGLKGVCFSIGAMELGLLAEKHEKAVKNGEISFVENHYDQLIKKYKELLERLENTEPVMRS